MRYFIILEDRDENLKSLKLTMKYGLELDHKWKRNLKLIIAALLSIG